jgi:hypothetical protein
MVAKPGRVQRLLRETLIEIRFKKVRQLRVFSRLCQQRTQKQAGHDEDQQTFHE